MLKKIALAGLFAITFAVGMGSASSAAATSKRAPHYFCGAGRIC
ncbi:MAG TPA: hypothetical protein VHH90_10135 [Polyangia bacterium]|nr:hypothetical protein [Polyangia bacterium]